MRNNPYSSTVIKSRVGFLWLLRASTNAAKDPKDSHVWADTCSASEQISGVDRDEPLLTVSSRTDAPAVALVEKSLYPEIRADASPRAGPPSLSQGFTCVWAWHLCGMSVHSTNPIKDALFPAFGPLALIRVFLTRKELVEL